MTSSPWFHLRKRFTPGLVACLMLLLASHRSVFAPRTLTAQTVQHDVGAKAELRGEVVDREGKPVAGVLVRLGGRSEEATTDPLGRFLFRSLDLGHYEVTAECKGLHSEVVSVELRQGSRDVVRMVLQPGSTGLAAVTKPSQDQTLEFSDKPDFVISGITDWTAVGGHGSDATLRTSEDLARETIRLKGAADVRGGSGADNKGSPGTTPAPESGTSKAGSVGGCNAQATTASAEYAAALQCQREGRFQQALQHTKFALAKTDTAAYHRLAGELEEQLGDPLASVQQDQRATQLEPSEENYFAWGSELLLHRAIWQAAEVFSNGAQRHPLSARLKTGWGTALFAGARYEEAAQRLCEASDLDPAERESYIFLGKVSIGTPTPLACVPGKLERFVEQRPDDADANYYDAMLLLKDGGAPHADRAAALLRKAVALDPKYSAAYIQLGILLTAQHRYPEAIQSLRQALEAAPQEAEPHYRLGVLYERTGKADEAQREFHTHELLAGEQASAVETERRQVKQFLVTLQGTGLPGAIP